MTPAARYSVYILSLAVAVFTFCWGLFRDSPSLAAGGFCATIASVLVLAGVRLTGKGVLVQVPVIQSVALAVSLLLSEAFDLGYYHGYLLGDLAYPAISATALVLIVAYTHSKIYRALIIFFMVAVTVVISNINGVFIYAMLESEMDQTLTNNMNTLSFAFCFVYGIIAAFAWGAYSRFVQHNHYYLGDFLLEEI